MPDILNSRVVASLHFLGRLGSFAAILLGSLVLAGWLTGSQSMVTVLPGLAAMSPITACAFVLGGLSLGARKLTRAAFADVMAVLLLALAVVMLAGYVMTGRDVLSPVIGNQLTGVSGNLVGLTAPATACGFLLLGIALIWVGRTGRRHERIVVACSASGLLISGLSSLI